MVLQATLKTSIHYNRLKQANRLLGIFTSQGRGYPHPQSLALPCSPLRPRSRSTVGVMCLLNLRQIHFGSTHSSFLKQKVQVTFKTN